MNAICEACGEEYVPYRVARARFCPICSTLLHKVPYRNDELLVRYVGYRARMRMKYDDGPWTPDRVAPQDRWRAWEARRSRAS